MPAERQRHDRAGFARYVVFGLMALYLVIGAAFAIGESFAEPRGVLFAASWAIPSAALCALAVFRPALAERVLVVAVIVAAAFIVADFVPGRGPTAALAAFAVSIPVAILGLSRPALAGKLLIGTALALAVGIVNGAPPVSARAVVVPLLLFGMLFWITDSASDSHGRRASLPDRPSSRLR
jgi:hypothetical protein